MKSKNYILILALLAVFSSCKKELIAPGSVITSTSNKSTIVPYSFDWELGDYMPAPAGTNILVPWASSANRSFPLIYTTDIKKTDGWELVYNTFDVNQFTQPAYFILYNKYRGLFRGYFYLTPGATIPSSNISHSLTQDVSNNPAPILSYSAKEVSNLSIKTPVTSTVQEFKTSSTGTWYAAEFEMAYDPAIVNKDANSTKMTWAVNSVNTTNIILNGTSKGAIKGTITQSAPSSNLLGSTIPGLMTFPVEGAIDSWDLPDVITKALKTGLTSGLGGVAKNVLNGIFGGSSETSQYANLTTSADIQMSGTATDVYQLQNPSLVIPGTLGQDNVSGYTPLYKDPLGIVALTSAPIVDLNVPTYGGDGDGPSETDWDSATITLDPNSYQIIFNPSVINSSPTGATIQNLKQQIVSFKNYTSPLTVYHYGSYQTVDSPVPDSKTKEQIDNKTVIIDEIPANYLIPFRLHVDLYDPNSVGRSALTYSDDGLDNLRGKAMPSTVLRISFDVVPNNGAPKSTIIKAFNLILKNYN